MFISIFLGVMIFGYAAWHLYRFWKKSREEGPCGTCSLKDSCQSGCSIVPPEKRQEYLKKMKKGNQPLDKAKKEQKEP